MSYELFEKNSCIRGLQDFGYAISDFGKIQIGTQI